MDLIEILCRLGAMKRQRKSRAKTSMHVPSRFSGNSPEHGSSFAFVGMVLRKDLQSFLSLLVRVDYVILISSIFHVIPLLG